MITNFHTHSTYCDGDNTLEEIVLSAIEKGFSAIGFSGHGYTYFDLTYCMKDTDGYIAEINALKEKYRNKIQIYLGVEEDSRSPVKNREDFDYIIGSSHCTQKNSKLYAIDHSPELFEKCLEVWRGDTLAFAEEYYGSFCDYILKRKPDIIGHFDLITKFDENENTAFLENEEYKKLARKYIEIAAQSGCIFEVNTGGISRNWRKTPYPSEDLLYTLKKCGGRVLLSSDSHNKETLDFGFADATNLLREIGFEYVYTLFDGEFIREHL